MTELEGDTDITVGGHTFTGISRIHFGTYSALRENFVLNAQKAQRYHYLIELLFRPRYSDKSFITHAQTAVELNDLCETVSDRHHVCASWRHNEAAEAYEILFVPRDE